MQKESRFISPPVGSRRWPSVPGAEHGLQREGDEGHVGPAIRGIETRQIAQANLGAVTKMISARMRERYTLCGTKRKRGLGTSEEAETATPRAPL